VCSERSVPVALGPPQIPRAVARNRTWDSAVRHRPDYSSSHVAVSTINFQYEYQPLNKLCDQVTANIRWSISRHLLITERLHYKSTGKNVVEAAVANAVLPLHSCLRTAEKTTKNTEQPVFRPSHEPGTYERQVYSVAATPNCSVLLILTL
jgi:hypothetical protein